MNHENIRHFVTWQQQHINKIIFSNIIKGQEVAHILVKTKAEAFIVNSY